MARQSAELAQQVTVDAMRWMRHSRYITAALVVVVCPLMTIATLKYTGARREGQMGTVAQKDEAQPERAEAEAPSASPIPDKATETTGLDGGTALAQEIIHALPMPPGGLPGQRPAPCPSYLHELNGYCWSKHQLSAAEVNDGMCETGLRLYEPAPGWCRSHLYGYFPAFLNPKGNNVVEPQ